MDDNNEVDARALTERVEQETGKWACLAGGNGYDEAMAKVLARDSSTQKTVATRCMKFAAQVRAIRRPDKATYQAMEALVHNLNTMHSPRRCADAVLLASTTARIPRRRAAW